HSPGGEGSPQWWFTPETHSGWRSNTVFNTGVRNPKAEPVTIPGHPDVAPVSQGDDQKYHTDDWFHCMHTRGVPNGNIDTGFGHAVAVVMATRAYREEKKLYWDRKNEQIVDRRPG